MGGDSRLLAYNAAKAAVINLTRAAAIDCAPYGVRVNSVSPGLTASEMSAPVRADASFWNERMKLIPLGRAAEPSEIVNGIAFLASEEASYVTGANLVVDGGSWLLPARCFLPLIISGDTVLVTGLLLTIKLSSFPIHWVITII
jgi:meso-butanediol dehydrogenase / (S,S)-butanediol dehydrogenase / diacetyl reductase